MAKLTKLYHNGVEYQIKGGGGVTPVTDAGIYHNPKLGLISLSGNGNIRYTIKDKNLGAYTVYNGVDALSQANCGFYFQRGNNYGFPFSTYMINSQNTQVTDNDIYGPDYYFASSRFVITGTTSRMNIRNDDMRGGTTGTNVAMQGPCEGGFHIPTSTELGDIKSILTSLGIDTSNANCLKTYLFMPFAGYRHYTSGNTSGQGTALYYWASNAYSATLSYVVYGTTSALSMPRTLNNTYGFPIREFSNTAVQPDSDWTVLYQGS